MSRHGQSTRRQSTERLLRECPRIYEKSRFGALHCADLATVTGASVPCLTLEGQIKPLPPPFSIKKKRDEAVEVM